MLALILDTDDQAANMRSLADAIGMAGSRNGSTFAGMLFGVFGVFGVFGAFRLSLFAIVQFFIKLIPPAQTGHAFGSVLYAFVIRSERAADLAAGEAVAA